MKYPRKKISVKAGLPPGSMIHIGRHSTEVAQIELYSYNKDEVIETEVNDLSQITPFLQKEDCITWIDLKGINHLETIEQIGKLFNIHPLVLEDIVNAEQRPKFEDYNDYLFFTLKTMEVNGDKFHVDYGQISIIVGKNFVITFQEKVNNLFGTIRNRLLSGVSRARTRQSDFLVYLIVDSVVDSYFHVIEKFSDILEDEEEKMLKDDRDNGIINLQAIRRGLSQLLRVLYPLREALSRLEKRDCKLINQETLIFFRDVYDHTIHLIESVENQRDILAGAMDVYLTMINNRLNSIMKVLTIIATIFIPLSFFASVYGMNFKYFPELGWRYGYLYFWILILIVLGLMLYYFRRKKWL
jgi:magnesium transporter